MRREEGSLTTPRWVGVGVGVRARARARFRRPSDNSYRTGLGVMFVLETVLISTSSARLFLHDLNLGRFLLLRNLRVGTGG